MVFIALCILWARPPIVPANAHTPGTVWWPLFFADCFLFKQRPNAFAVIWPRDDVRGQSDERLTRIECLRLPVRTRAMMGKTYGLLGCTGLGRATVKEECEGRHGRRKNCRFCLGPGSEIVSHLEAPMHAVRTKSGSCSGSLPSFENSRKHRNANDIAFTIEAILSERWLERAKALRPAREAVPDDFVSDGNEG